MAPCDSSSTHTGAGPLWTFDLYIKVHHKGLIMQDNGDVGNAKKQNYTLYNCLDKRSATQVEMNSYISCPMLFFLAMKKLTKYQSMKLY